MMMIFSKTINKYTFTMNPHENVNLLRNSSHPQNVYYTHLCKRADKLNLHHCMASYRLSVARRQCSHLQLVKINWCQLEQTDGYKTFTHHIASRKTSSSIKKSSNCSNLFFFFAKIKSIKIFFLISKCHR